VAGGAYGFLNVSFANCTFSGNSSQNGGGLLSSYGTECVNCSFSGNTGGGIAIANEDGGIIVNNSILWGNAPFQIQVIEIGPPAPPSLVDQIFIYNSNIQGGWYGPGSNNISADPLFIQPGCDNLRLGVGSPCLDAGDNSLIPAGITTDLDGNPRIINAIVDMGAYEGEHEMLPPAACAGDIDEGEFVQLTPNGGPFNPLLKPAATISNDSTQNDAYATVTQVEAQLHSGAVAYNELGSKLQVDTSLVPGAFLMRIFINFDAAQLNGFDPLALDLTHFDAETGEYLLAAASNIQSSPGHKGPLGDRQVIVGTSWQSQISWDVGDYGIFWNPDQQKGFAWANVDHASDFAFGVPLPQCTGDCTFPSDGVIDLQDLTLVLDNWGTPPAGPASFADITNNGIVDVDDLLAVIHAWGECK
jgi:hypothetical protein